MPSQLLREDTIDIWRAGVRAVDSQRLVERAVAVEDERLSVLDESIPLSEIGRVVVLGGGKAGAGMAAGVETVFAKAGCGDRLGGVVNVPADCVRSLSHVELHAARPAGLNEPTAEGVVGTERILDLARSLGPRDVGIVLISGGGSALLPAPAAGVTLADKQAVTRTLAAAGATINELNTVRKHLSAIKGGGLARAASGARRVFTLIISDVIGDPLDVIASGPTVADSSSAADALAILERLALVGSAARDCIAETVFARLRGAASEPRDVPPNVVNHVVGSNAVALAAAADRARELGYTVESLGSENAGIASEVGRDLAERCRNFRATSSAPTCLLSGGEPTVKLASTDRLRRGGRNQEVALAAVAALWDDGANQIVVLSGGTDGEDGPTDAAGGFADAAVIRTAKDRGLDPAAHLAINDSYGFLEPAGGLLVTGPTHTNVMDLRVALVGG